MTMRFEKNAIDLVGTFQRSKAGIKYLVTVIEMASQYPEALPLKVATATEVAEGLRQILSDQVSNFTRKVITDFCQRLQIDQINMSPYH